MYRFTAILKLGLRADRKRPEDQQPQAAPSRRPKVVEFSKERRDKAA